MTVRRAPGWLKERICAVLHEHGRPLSGTALALRLSDQSGPVHHSAVFRALEQLREAGGVRRIESLSAYVPDDGVDAIDCICRECRVVRTLTEPALVARLRRLAIRSAFSPGRLIVELSGTCDRCRPALALPTCAIV